jgi:hypothetical protein
MLPEGLARDPRLLPVRGGIAAEHLKGVIAAARYSPGTRKVVTAGAAALRKGPDSGGEQVNQALFGESFTVYDEQDGWAWGQLAADHYVGWIRADELGPAIVPTHRLSVLRSFLFEAPNLKSAPLKAVSMNALLTLGESEGGFTRVLKAGGAQALVYAAVGRVLASMLYAVGPMDPLVLVGGIAALLGAALLASWVPARRAARVDPIVALRPE